MGQAKSKSSTSSTDTVLPRVPHGLKFQILLVGRANAGKTTILQCICDSTKSSEVFKLGPRGNHERVELHPTMERGEHDIDDELVITDCDRYVFHDTRGFEAGSDDELKIIREFVRRKSREKRLKNRLHAIWYCIPMDNDRPSLDLKYLEDICPDKNVPVIAVFTKYNQFKCDIEMDRDHDAEAQLHVEIDRVFNVKYLARLKGTPPYICLEKTHQAGADCNALIKLTSDALSGSVVSLLLAVQRGNLELSINRAVRKSYSTLEQGRGSIEEIIKLCILAFPSLWVGCNTMFWIGSR